MVVAAGAAGGPRPDQRLAWLLALSALPAATIGALLESTVGDHLGQIWLIAVLLIVFGLVLLVADRLPGDRDAEEFRLRDAAMMGLCQAAALAPGVSRSGITITGGRFLGFQRDAAARLSFLMSLPVIAGAGIYQGAKVFAGDGLPSGTLPAFVWGMLASAVTGAVAVWLVMRVVRTKSFTPFVIYRVVVGVAVLGLAGDELSLRSVRGSRRGGRGQGEGDDAAGQGERDPGGLLGRDRHRRRLVADVDHQGVGGDPERRRAALGLVGQVVEGGEHVDRVAPHEGEAGPAVGHRHRPAARREEGGEAPPAVGSELGRHHRDPGEDGGDDGPAVGVVDRADGVGGRAEAGSWRRARSAAVTTVPGSRGWVATTTGRSGPYCEARAPALPITRAATIPVSRASTATTSQ